MIRPVYCYICNQPMGNVWVCSNCIEKFDLHGPTVWNAWDSLPSRKTPSDPIPDWVKSKYCPESWGEMELDEGI